MTEENMLLNSIDGSPPHQVEVVKVRHSLVEVFDSASTGKRKRAPGDVLIGELMIRALKEEFGSFFSHFKNRAAQNRHFRGFVQKLRADEDLCIAAEGGQRELDELDDALKVLDVYQTEVRHYTWEDCLDALGKAVGRALYKEGEKGGTVNGVGFAVPFEHEEMIVLDRKKAHIMWASRQLEDIPGPGPASDKQTLLHKLRTGSRRGEYELGMSPTRVDIAEAPLGSAAFPGLVEPNRSTVNSPENDPGEASAESVGGVISAATTTVDPGIAELERLVAALRTDDAECIERRIAAQARSVSSQGRDSYLRKGPLPPEQEHEVDEIFNCGSGHDIVVTAFNAELTRQDLRRLLPCTWLNDEVVNMYMKLLDHRDKELCARDTSRRPSHFFSSFFLTKLTENRKYNYRGVKRWTRKIKIFEMDKVFCPVNIANMHWCMAVIFVQHKRINFYDSLGGTGAQTTDALMKWLYDEYRDKHGDDGTFYEDEWSVKGTDIDTTPQQDNGSDCGAFAVAFASYLSDGLPFDFSQADITQMRRRMLWSLVHQELV